MIKDSLIEDISIIGQVDSSVGYVHVRKNAGASGKYDIIGKLNNEELIEIIEKILVEETTWYKFKYENSEAFVSGDYIKILNPTIINKYANINIPDGEVVDVRVLPKEGTECKVIAQLNNNVPIDILEELHPKGALTAWYKIKYYKFSNQTNDSLQEYDTEIMDEVGFIKSDLISFDYTDKDMIRGGWFRSRNGNWYYFIGEKVLTGIWSIDDQFRVLDKNGKLFFNKQCIETELGLLSIDENGVATYINNSPIEDISAIGQVESSIEEIEVRKSAGTGTECDILGKLKDEELIEITGKILVEEVIWYKFKYGNSEVFVSGDHIKILNPITINRYANINIPDGEVADVRVLPGESAECKAITQLNNNAPIDVLEEFYPKGELKAWYKIKYYKISAEINNSLQEHDTDMMDGVGFIKSDSISFDYTNKDTAEDRWFKSKAGNLYFFCEGEAVKGLQVIDDLFALFDKNGRIVMDTDYYKTEDGPVYARDGVAHPMEVSPNIYKLNLLGDVPTSKK